MPPRPQAIDEGRKYQKERNEQAGEVLTHPGKSGVMDAAFESPDLEGESAETEEQRDGNDKHDQLSADPVALDRCGETQGEQGERTELPSGGEAHGADRDGQDEGCESARASHRSDECGDGDCGQADW